MSCCVSSTTLLGDIFCCLFLLCCCDATKKHVDVTSHPSCWRHVMKCHMLLTLLPSILLQQQTTIPTKVYMVKFPRHICLERLVTPVSSQFCELAWYHWIMYIPGTVQYPDKPFGLLKCLVSAIDVGPAVTTQILLQNSGVVHRRTYQPLTLA